MKRKIKSLIKYWRALMSEKLYNNDKLGGLDPSDLEPAPPEDQPVVIGDLEPAEPKPGLPPQPPKDVEDA
jgi:hypothetical protein